MIDISTIEAAVPCPSQRYTLVRMRFEGWDPGGLTFLMDTLCGRTHLQKQGLVTNQGSEDVEVTKMSRNGADLKQNEGGEWVVTDLGTAVAEHIVREGMEVSGSLRKGSMEKWRKELKEKI